MSVSESEHLRDNFFELCNFMREKAPILKAEYAESECIALRRAAEVLSIAGVCLMNGMHRESVVRQFSSFSAFTAIKVGQSWRPFIRQTPAMESTSAARRSAIHSLSAYSAFRMGDLILTVHRADRGGMSMSVDRLKRDLLNKLINARIDLAAYLQLRKAKGYSPGTLSLLQKLNQKGELPPPESVLFKLRVLVQTHDA